MIKKILKLILFSVIVILFILITIGIVPEWLCGIISFLIGIYITQEVIPKTR